VTQVVYKRFPSHVIELCCGGFATSRTISETAVSATSTMCHVAAFVSLQNCMSCHVVCTVSRLNGSTNYACCERAST
jgi:hypothetical protein